MSGLRRWGGYSRPTIGERLTEWLRTGEHDVLIAEIGDRLIGSLWELIRVAEDLARAAGVRKIWLGVYGPNARARALYEQLGYVVEGVQQEQYPRPTLGVAWDQVLMAKFLDRP